MFMCLSADERRFGREVQIPGVGEIVNLDEWYLSFASKHFFWRGGAPTCDCLAKLSRDSPGPTVRKFRQLGIIGCGRLRPHAANLAFNSSSSFANPSPKSSWAFGSPPI